uniref:Uncharacterized protein n=1 Tax=Amphimedon queenslandica TaxID=400682 RepID=A0A1X7VXA9_AMPQE
MSKMIFVVVSLYLEDFQTLNVKKTDNTKCVVKNDHCSSSLIVSKKLSSIKLKTSSPKKIVIFTYKSLPSQRLSEGDNEIMFITLVMKNFKEGCVRL